MKQHTLQSIFKFLTAAILLVCMSGAATAQEISISSGGNINTGGTRTFTDTNVNSSSSPVSFTISNTGTSALTLGAFSITGSHAADFEITAYPAGYNTTTNTGSLAAPVAPATSTTATFEVTFTPSARGARNAVLSIVNNDPDGGENPFVINLTGDGLAPEISVENPAGLSNAIPSGQVAPYDMGVVNLAGSPSSQSTTFTIRNVNTATANLTLSTITKSGTNAADFTITQPALTNLNAGSTTTFTVTFNPTTSGTKTAQISIPNNDPDGSENPYVINLTGEAASPTIQLEQPVNTVIANNDTKAFPDTSAGLSSSLTFTIRNSSSVTLTLSSMTIGGPEARKFEFVGTKPTSVPANQTREFTIRFSPVVVGSNSATLTIANNSATSSFVVNLTGQGVVPAARADAFGYECTEIAGGNVLPFLDSADPTVLTDANFSGIDKFVPVDIGFDFYFYEKAYSRCFISTTGLITFGTSSVDFNPERIPNNNTPNEFIAPLWTDLEIVPNDSKILYKTIGTSPERIFVVKYERVRLYQNGSGVATNKRVTFQVQLYESSNSIQIRYQDDTPSITAPAQEVTVGIESRVYTSDPKPGTNNATGIEYLYGASFPSVANSLFSPAKTLLFTRPVVITLVSRYQRPSFVPVQVNDCVTTLNSPTVTCTSTAGLSVGARLVGTNIASGAVVTGVTNATQFQMSIPATGAGTSTVTATPIYPVTINNCVTTTGSKTITCSSTAGLLESMDVTGLGIPAGTLIESVDSATAFTISNAATASGTTALTVSGIVDVGSESLGLIPTYGTIYGTKIGTVRKFEAPEFIYLDRNLNTLPSAGQLTDINPAWYRLANDGYSIDGQVVQGANAFFTTTLTRDVTIVWRWRLEYAAVVDRGNSATAVNGEGRHWIKPGEQFTAVIDNPLEGLAGASGFRQIVQSYSLSRINVFYGSSTTQTPAETKPVTAGAYIATTPVSMIQPIKIVWNWAIQVRYRFEARKAGISADLLNSQSFVRIWDGYVPQLPGPPVVPEVPGTPGAPTFGVGPLYQVWINAGSKVTVGAFYRTKDRRFTLRDFAAPPGGNLTPIGSSVSALADGYVTDVDSDSRVARGFTTIATSPTDITWLYEPTVFRAEVVIGDSFNPQTPSSANFQLVPDLPDGSSLRVTSAGPGTSIETKILPPDGSVLNGLPLRWDSLAQRLFPVQPGSYRVAWPDASSSGETYNIEIVSALPGERAALTTDREFDDGLRELEVSSPGPPIVYGTTRVGPITPPMASVSSDYPAAPAAHYRHIYDSAPGRRPPTKLDISSADEWAYKDLPFAEKITAASADQTADGVPFRASGTGRSVVLYSQRPNPDESANGDLTKETLAVRVISSTALSPISRNDSMLVLGRRALQLGSSSHTGGAYAVVQAGAPTTSSIDPGSQFAVDFWLNTKELKPSAPIALSNCTTVLGSTTVTCASTSGLVAGMGISGSTIPAGAKIASVSNATTMVLTLPATADGSSLSLSATNKPVTVFSTGGGTLQVTLDPEASTTTATYRGNKVTHILSKTGAAWRHFTLHAFTYSFFGVEITILDFYLDGVREEVGFVSSMYPGTAVSTVASTVETGSLRFGVDATPDSNLFLDNFRVFALGADPLGYLQPAEVRLLRTKRNMMTGTLLRSAQPLVSFDFEAAPANGWFPSQGSLAAVGVGTVSGSGQYPGKWAYTDLQEVATRIDSTLDNAAFRGTGYILNAVSNYNGNLYSRSAEIGQWGPIFPVNHSQLFTDATKRLEVAYYENLYLTDRANNPNVAWPYVATGFNEVVYPTLGKDKDKAIYIASRIGSEGVDRNGKVQQVFDAATYADLQIYHQSSTGSPGYNPNEEHALVAPGGRAALKVKNLGEDVPNSQPLAAFALQRDINTRSAGYTSDPWVLVQVNNVVTGEPEMAAYQVFKTRTGTVPFPRPSTAVVNTPGSGLSYEAASNPEDGFLMIDSSRAINFSYQFEYQAFAGDLLVPPYPLNLVIGNVAMNDARGNSLQVNGVNQRTLWRDVNKNAWVVSGNGRFFHQFFYPFRGDFFLPGAQAGTPVAWIPDDGVSYTGTGTSLHPVKVLYDTFWRSDYPKLKRGETLTYQGGEYFNETPGAKGLPALVAMAASEIVYDSATPSMSFGAVTTNRYDISSASARLMRPLDRREELFTVAQMGSSGFTPAATTKVLIIAERWYFKELPGSLQKRFYFDSLAEKLVLRGRLNEKESGDPNLTSGPDPLNILEPNVLTSDEYTRMRALSTNSAWTSAIDQIYLKSQNPESVAGGNTNATLPARNLQGVKNAPANYPAELSTYWIKSGSLYSQTTSPAPSMVPLDSFGVGSALVPNPSLLTQAPNGSLYVTIAENNRSELSGAPVSLHIIEIIPDRYRGAIKVIEGSDAFSEKVTLQHNGEFGANTGDLYYEWWIRDAGPLDLVATEILADGTLKQTDASGQTLWQEYLPAERAAIADSTAKRLGMHTIVFEGRPDVVLADKLVLMRYRHKNESNWRLVPFEFANASTAWKPGNVQPVSAAPFQWAGAANSPQLQADGSKRYIPQLIMGWVKRVLDRINPYEARYNDFFSNESPATYSSQIQIAGGPYAGKVALNPDKNVIENTGLIELYRTVLDRARELSIDNSSNGNATDGINQALLLAATRLSVLYELLANEAYSDAQDSTINSGEDSALVGIASYTHAFQNMEADLQHEELALLRGTDFGKSYPVYNRIFWNYAKGLGEAAYNVNYNIYDVNKDGFINEDDARKLYPQGHGDAWGHYVSSLDMHYVLLQHPGFTWRTRSELYSLMQNVLEVDFLDEKTFSRLGAARARAGRDIVRNTYRLKYTQNPNGQWQGYTDSADPARAWGVSEWAHRAGQAAHFDWAVANALLPEEADAATPISNPENLDRIERSGSVDDIGAIAAGLHEIQVAMDEANKGVNPLGFDSDAMAFDIELPSPENTHFEQIYNRALEAANNALATLEMATQSQNKLRSLADDTEGLIQEAMAQDLDYRNRLIEIFGRPYDGTIGVGKAYPEGYLGPDTLLFAYLDKTRIDQIVPPKAGGSNVVTFDVVTNNVIGIMNKPTMVSLYNSVWGGQSNTRLRSTFETLIDSNMYQFEPSPGSTFTAPYTTASRYAFQSLPGWGNRTSYGRTQTALGGMLAAEIELDTALATYTAYIKDLENKLRRIDSQLALFELKHKNHQKITDARRDLNIELITLNTVFNVVAGAGEAVKEAAEAVEKALPTSIGFSNDVTSVGRGVASSVAGVATVVTQVSLLLKELNESIATAVYEAYEFKIDLNNEQIDQLAELEGMVEEYQSMTGNEKPLRDAIGAAILGMESSRQEYITAQAEGFRLLREREAYNKALAAKVQKNRYQDMVFRLSRNEAMSKYQSAFNAAAQYAWLAARAYDYETSLDPGHPAAAGQILDKIVRERQLGYWADGAPQVGRGGLAEILAQLKGNFNVLKGQLGINNPQSETDKISMRQELFRIHTLDPELQAALDLQNAVTSLAIPESSLTIDQRQLLASLSDPDNQEAIAQAPASDDRWEEALKARIVPNLNTMPEFVRYCRPSAGGVQPGLVIRFSTHIEPGKNLFGQPLMAGDHIYSTANFATKVMSLGVWMDDYNAAGLSTAPRAYLVPLGEDYLRTSTSTLPIVRSWSLVEQRIPTPFVINQSALSSPEYIPTLDGVDGSFAELRRYGDFRIYHNNGDPEADDSELIMDSRLTGRSVWNSQWMLVIPGSGLGVDPNASLNKLAENISDIKLYFLTTSHQGQ